MAVSPVEAKSKVRKSNKGGGGETKSLNSAKAKMATQGTKDHRDAKQKYLELKKKVYEAEAERDKLLRDKRLKLANPSRAELLAASDRITELRRELSAVESSMNQAAKAVQRTTTVPRTASRTNNSSNKNNSRKKKKKRKR